MSHGHSDTPPRALGQWPVFAEDEQAAVADVLASGKVNYWTGDQGQRFETDFAAYCGVPFGIALSNGTVALELALRALGVGPGDDVLVPCRTFIATASAVVTVGARPIVCDVDRDSQCLTVETARAALTPATKAMIPVHLAGWPADMDALMAFAAEHGLWVVEDCAQAHGATYRGRRVGGLGHAAAFSFCQDKIMTTGGEGGMLVTADEGVWRRAWEIKDHGKSYEAVFERAHPPGFRWLHDSFGTNMRMTEMQAAIGRRQLAKLDDWLAIRRRNAAILSDHLGVFDSVRLTPPPADIGHAYYKFYAFIRPDRLRPGWSRDRVMTEAVDQGVPCFTGISPDISREAAFTRAGLVPPAPLATALELDAGSLCLLVHPTLTVEDMTFVAETLAAILARATAPRLVGGAASASSSTCSSEPFDDQPEHDVRPA